MGEGDGGVGNLARAGFAAELGEDLGRLGDAGGAERVAAATTAATNGPASPFLQNPSSSYAISSAIEKQSWTSAMSTSRGPMPAAAYAAWAARFMAGQ